MFDSIVLYICADNDLSDYANQDLEELKSLPIPQYIQVDQRRQRWGDTAPNSYRIKRQKGKETKRFLEQELNTGDTTTSQNFLNWVESQGASLQHSLFVFWGHGQGWMGSCNDFLNQDRLDLLEMQQILSNYNFKAIGFDACIMSSLEVIEVVASSTPYVLASQEVEPKQGWQYTYLNPKAKDWSAAIETMANQFVGQQLNQPLCLALLQTEYIPQLISELNELFARLHNQWKDCRQLLNNLPRIANGEYVDLHLLLEQMELHLPVISKQAAKLKKLVEERIVINNYSNRSNYRGISIWLPISVADYKLEAYSKLPIAASCPAYQELLRRYVQAKNAVSISD